MESVDLNIVSRIEWATLPSVRLVPTLHDARWIRASHRMPGVKRSPARSLSHTGHRFAICLYVVRSALERLTAHVLSHDHTVAGVVPLAAHSSTPLGLANCSTFLRYGPSGTFVFERSVNFKDLLLNGSVAGHLVPKAG